MIEIGNHPGGIGAVMLHSTESGQFLACERIEFERLAAAIKRGDLDAFLGMREASAAADGDANWASAAHPEVTEGDPVAAAPAAVITADSTVMDGLVIRWRVSVHGPAVLSASRDHVMVHGAVDLAVIAPWLDQARRVHEALKAGRRDEAAALATHWHSRAFGGDLVPIERSDP